MAESIPRTAVGEKVGRLLSDPGRPLPELLKRLGIARNLLGIWLKNPDNDGSWMSDIVHVRLLVDSAESALKQADNIESRALYKEAGQAFYGLWAKMSQSPIEPTIIDETIEALGNAGDAVKKAAGIGIGTIVIGLVALHFLTKGRHDS